jgi:hypothetical protein
MTFHSGGRSVRGLVLVRGLTTVWLIASFLRRPETQMIQQLGLNRQAPLARV